MKFEKQIQGEFAKPNRDFHDGDIIQLLSEGEKRLAPKSNDNDKDRWQWIFKARVGGDVKIIKLNGTSLNNMIEAFGTESKDWIEKDIKVWVKEQLVGNKTYDVAYFAHPEAECTKGEDHRLKFVLPEEYRAVEKPEDAK